jgi:hypothetical protein
MRKLFLGFSLILIIGCSEKRNKLNGYYYSQNTPLILNFDKSKVEFFNYNDFTSSIYKYHIDKKEILLKNKRYNYLSNQDTILIYNFVNDVEKL